MVMLPSFRLRRRKAQAIKFVPVHKVFKSQVKVLTKSDISGWVDRDRRIKWEIGAGRVGYLDEDKAREFAVKGYVEILDGKVRPVSEDEAAEMLSTVTTINLGAPRG